MDQRSLKEMAQLVEQAERLQKRIAHLDDVIGRISEIVEKSDTRAAVVTLRSLASRDALAIPTVEFEVGVAALRALRDQVLCERAAAAQAFASL